MSVNRRATAQGALALGALGVVFGDIGTSPLYTVQTVFNPDDPHPVKVSAENVFGIISLISWSVMIIVTVTYVLLVMRADNDGEGGIMALITLIRRGGVPGGRRTKIVLAALGIFGASLFFGDSMITPAISVLSAMGDPGSIQSPFFLLAPVWARLPMVFLAAAATVIASQAVITGAFSVAHQAAQLGYLPRLRVTYTSEEQMGQIYVPWINWLLLVSVLTLVVTFKSSAALAYAFGMAVTGTITITTLLFFYIVRYQWHKPLWMVAPGAAFLLTVDLLFFAANLTKLVSGAWLPLLIALAAFTVFTTWQRGRQLVTAQRDREEGPLRAFIDQLHDMRPPLPRVPGTAVFLNRGKATAPLALRANVKHNQILHQHVLILAIETMPVPHVPAGDRITVDDLGYSEDRIVHVTARFGYIEQPHVPDLLPLIRDADIESPLDDHELSYFLSRIELVRGSTPGMNRWRKRLFIATSRITADAAEYFQLPREQTLIVGSRIEL